MDQITIFRKIQDLKQRLFCQNKVFSVRILEMLPWAEWNRLPITEGLISPKNQCNFTIFSSNTSSAYIAECANIAEFLCIIFNKNTFFSRNLEALLFSIFRKKDYQKRYGFQMILRITVEIKQKLNLTKLMSFLVSNIFFAGCSDSLMKWEEKIERKT